MENKSKELLEESLEREYKSLENLEPGSEERTRAVNNIATLYKLKEQTKDRIFKFMGGVIDTGLPLILFGGLSILGFIFEEHGTICSPTFKGIINCCRPKK